MPRLALVLLALTLFVPAASAGPIAVVAVGPGGPASEGEPYYLRAQVEHPEGPHPADGSAACRAPEGADGSSASPTDAILSWDPRADGGISSWFPRCVDVHAGMPVHASYNVTTGRYYVGAGLPIPFVATTQQAFGVTGTTGIAIEADCELCPPPATL